MARTITDEEIKLSIVINGNPAQKQLLDLEKSTRALTEQKKALQIELRRTEQSLGKESQEYKNLQLAIKKVNGEIDNNKATMKELQNQIGITGLTMAQLTQKAIMLKMTLRNLVPGSADYVRYQQELNQVNTRIGELNGRATQAGFSIGRIADGFNRYAALGASVLGFFAGMVVSVQKIIDLNGKLSDAQSNVMKTTGMTKKEVDDLTKSFGVLQTRTSRIDLLGIAETGGRLGIAKEDIQDFVKVMDKASVALGDSFEGGPEIVAEKLGKIKGLYGELQDTNVEFAFNAVGSAMNDLGAAGAASEQNIADFATRIGSMPEAFKPSIAEALALGAAFEESGLTAEIAATNYSKVITIAAGNASGFAQVMGKSKKEIENLINTKPNEFFLQFANSIKNLSGTDLAKVLDSLKLNDAQVKQVLGAAGKNVDMFRNKIDLASKSLADGTSLTNEFEIKNNNLAATLEKIKKTVSSWFSSEEFVKWLEVGVTWFAKFIGATEDADGNIVKWKNTLVNTAKIIAIVIAGMVSYRATLQLVAFWSNTLTSSTALLNLAQKANALTGGLLKTIYLGLKYAFYALTIQTEKAIVAQNAFNMASKMNPIGLVVGLIMAAAAAYVAFNKEVSIATKNETNLKEVREKANVAMEDEKSKLMQLIAIAKDESQSKKTRLDAIKKINEIHPEYLKGITLESINTMEASKAIQEYLGWLDKKYMKEAFASKKGDLRKEINDKKYDPEERYGTSIFNDRKIDYLKIYEAEQKALMNLTNEERKHWSFIQGLRKDENAIKNEELTYYKATKNLSEEENKLLNQKNYSPSELRGYLNYRKGINESLLQFNDLSQEEAKFIKSNADLYVAATTTEETTTTGGGTGDDDKKKEKKYDDSYLDDEKRRQKELYELQMKNEEERINLFKDGYLKESLLENLHHADKLQKLQNNLSEQIELQSKLEKDIVAAEKAGDTAKATSLKNQLADTIEIQKQIGSQVEHEQKMHLLRMATIQEKGGMQEVDKLKEKYEREKQLRETAFLEEMASLSLSEEEKEKRKKEFQERELQMEEAMLKEQINLLNKMIDDVNFEGIDFSLLSPEDEEKLRIQIEAIQNAIAKLKAAKSGEEEDGAQEIDLGLGGDVDILGFSQDQWENFFKNIEQGTIGVQTMQMAVQAMQGIWSEYDKYMTASENASLKKYEKNQDARKRALKKQLDQGQINQVQYKRKVEEMDQELERKKAEIEYKQAKRKKTMDIVNTVINTAVAIMQAYSQLGPIGGTVAAVLIGTLGALQIATIAKQPLPARGYEEGLYPDYVTRSQDGKVFKSSGTSKMQTGLYSKPRILVGEGPGDMPEMVIDKRAFAQISPETKGALFRELRGIKGFENGYYKDNVFYTGASGGYGAAPIGSDSEYIKLMLAVVAENTSVMKELKESGVIAYFSKDYREMKKLQEELDKFKALKEKSKQ